MFTLKKQNKSKIGVPPGSIIYTGEKTEETIEIILTRYSKNEYDELILPSVSKYSKEEDLKKIDWLMLTGIHNINIIEELGRKIKIHSLVMEDIVNVFERVKIEVFDDSVFTILKKISWNENDELVEDHISILLYQNLLISFNDDNKDMFKQIKERLKHDRGRIRKLDADYLYYSIIDDVVDNYFEVLENLSDRIEDIEEELVKNPTEEVLFDIHRIKRDIIQIRKNVFPIREIINSIIRGDSKLIKNTTMIYFRDVYDHIIRIIETLESYRDMVSGLLDIYLSSTSNKMNEIMKVLTIIATVFIPLTFIVGVYGMNFQYMPELAWKYGYLIIWIIMFVILSGLVYFFKRKKWI